MTDKGARRSAFRALVFGRSYRSRTTRRQPAAAPTVLSRVRRLFTNHPILSNSLTYGTLCVAAEYCQQTLKNNRTARHGAMAKPLDVDAFKRYAAWGFLVIPPIYSKWYQWLDKAFKTSRGGHSLKVMLQKLFLDQFVLTPPVLLLFFLGMAAMEGQRSLTEECRTKFWPTFSADCCFWLPVQTFNFTYISPELRVVFIGVATFIWLNVLCFIKSLPVKDFVAPSASSDASPLPVNYDSEPLKFCSKDCLPVAGKGTSTDKAVL